MKDLKLRVFWRFGLGLVAFSAKFCLNLHAARTSTKVPFVFVTRSQTLTPFTFEFHAVKTNGTQTWYFWIVRTQGVRLCCSCFVIFWVTVPFCSECFHTHPHLTPNSAC